MSGVRGVLPTISIHAPRTGSDAYETINRNRELISIHAPRTGSDVVATRVTLQRSVFQSTLPARGATGERGLYLINLRFQSTLPARGATGLPRTHGRSWKFQSTLPARGATFTGNYAWRSVVISIHAPRTGSDWQSSVTRRCITHFNPRSPHGERRE